MKKLLQSLIAAAVLMSTGLAGAGSDPLKHAPAAEPAPIAAEALDAAALPEPGVALQLLAAFLVMGLVVSRRTRRQ